MNYKLIFKHSMLVAAISFLIGMTIVYFVFTKKQEKILPIRPFVVVSYEPYEFHLANTGIRYKIMDGVGNIFYVSEHLSYGQDQRYSLGDTIKLK